MSSSQTVTVLFTDMVDSTALTSGLTTSEADALRQEHFSELRQALAATEGLEVKNLGDGLMAAFSGTAAALSCAVAMQQAVDRGNRRRSVPVGLRVGISSGDVTVEEGDYFGEPVVEAARACAVCAPGQILVTDAVRTLAGRRSPQQLVDRGEHDLKGLPDPVRLWSVHWDPIAGATGIPLPDRLATLSTGPFGFVGRRDEVERLVQSVKTGAGTIIFVSGEPGMGKTTLCRQVSAAVHQAGVPVLYGRCDEDIAVSYQPFAEALGHLIAHADEDLLERHVAEYGGALLGLVPALGRRLPGLEETRSADPDSERYRLLGAVAGLLAMASENDGLLLVLDDLHWADQATLQMLRHLAEFPQHSRLAVVATYRDSELSAGDALSDALASIGRQATTERLRLTGLLDVDIIEMMEAVAGHEMTTEGIDLAHAVRRETEGNPFFTTEMLRHLGEVGLVYQNETGHWVASDDLYLEGLPQSVRQVVGQRVDRLGEDVRRLLSQAAVIGRDFDLELLAVVAEIDEDRALDMLDPAIEAALVVEVEGIVGRFSFAHALTQHTLYDDLGATRRARLHRRVATALEEECGDAPQDRAGELARHFLAATKTADVAKAITYCLMAAQQALEQQAPADALEWSSRAIELLGPGAHDPAVRCDLLVAMGTAERQLGNPSHRETLLEAAAAAEALGDTGRLTAAVLANSRWGSSDSGSVDLERVAVIERTLTRLPSDAQQDRALLMAILAAELRWDPSRRRGIRDEALRLAGELDDGVTLVRAVITVYNDAYNQSAPDAVLSDVTRALELAQQAGDSVAVFKAHQLLATRATRVADREALDHHLEQMVVLAPRLGQPLLTWIAVVMQAAVALLDGDLVRSQALADEALAVGSESVPEAMASFGAQILEISRIRHDPEALEGLAVLFADVARDNPGIPVVRFALARIYCDLDRPDEALATIAEDLAGGFTDLPEDDTTWLSAMVVRADVCAYLSHLEGSRLAYDRLLPYGQEVSTVQVTVHGPGALHLGELATVIGLPEADDHFAEALAMSRQLRGAYWTARTLISWATFLWERDGPGDRDRAAEMTDEALPMADRHGLESIRLQAGRAGLPGAVRNEGATD